MFTKKFYSFLARYLDRLGVNCVYLLRAHTPQLVRGGGRRAGGAYLVGIVPSFTTTRPARTTESSHLTKDGLDVGLAIKKHFGRPKTPDFVLILLSVPVQYNTVPPQPIEMG